MRLIIQLRLNRIHKTLSIKTKLRQPCNLCENFKYFFASCFKCYKYSYTPALSFPKIKEFMLSANSQTINYLAELAYVESCLYRPTPWTFVKSYRIENILLKTYQECDDAQSAFDESRKLCQLSLNQA